MGLVGTLLFSLISPRRGRGSVVRVISRSGMRGRRRGRSVLWAIRCVFFSVVLFVCMTMIMGWDGMGWDCSNGINGVNRTRIVMLGTSSLIPSNMTSIVNARMMITNGMP